MTDPTAPTFVKGHRIGRVVVEFPHICPGADCAIERWYREKVTRAEYENYVVRPARRRVKP